MTIYDRILNTEYLQPKSVCHVDCGLVCKGSIICFTYLHKGVMVKCHFSQCHPNSSTYTLRISGTGGSKWWSVIARRWWISSFSPFIHTQHAALSVAKVRRGSRYFEKEGCQAGFLRKGGARTLFAFLGQFYKCNWQIFKQKGGGPTPAPTPGSCHWGSSCIKLLMHFYQ